MSGKETQEYTDNASKVAIFDVNAIANCDTSIIVYLDLPVGTELEYVTEANRSGKLCQVPGPTPNVSTFGKMHNV